MALEFRPSEYRGKKIVYISIPANPGIYTIWDWNERKGKYVRRTEGMQYYGYRRIGGQQKTKYFSSFKDAKEWRESCAFVTDDVLEDNQETFKSIQQRFFDHIRSRVEVTTFETYESAAKHLWFFHPLPVGQISAKTIDAWLVELKRPESLKSQHKSRTTYQAELSLLGYILKYFSEYVDDTYQVPIKERHRRDCIVDLVKYKVARTRNQTNFIPREDAVLFLQEMKGRVDSRGRAKPQWALYEALAEFQFGCGARIGEVAAMTFEDVLDWKSGAVRISKTVQWSRKKGRPTRISPITKNGEVRTAYITERALNALRAWKLQCGRSNGLIFSFDGVDPVGYTSIQKRYDAAFVSLGMKWRGTHVMRHSYATDFLEKTKDKTALQGQLGHKTARQTDHYAKITQTAVQAGVRAYDQSLRENVVDLFREKTDENPDLLGSAR